MDDFFNHDVAEWISKSVSRMDDDEAEMFTRFFVYEVHKQDIENNRRTLNRHMEEVNSRLWGMLDDDNLALVSKAFDPDTPYEERFGKPQPRDRGGRWSKIGVTVERGKGPRPSKQGAAIYDRDKVKVGRVDLSNALSATDEYGSAFSQAWNQSGDNDHNTNERTYRRVRAGAQLLNNVPNKNVQAAAAVGDFAGKFGPEAEKVLGPAARRTAYRYRGTERMADHELGKIRDAAMISVRRRMYSDTDMKQKGGVPALTPEERMAASEEAATRYLFGRLPKKDLSKLHQESGKLPPSEGVIINRDGEIVTQAVGFNEDHYLPFNLKNLKGLQGGSYVRTRSTGGLTTEDIYTGLISGARSITVVSRSGVFSLDFQDDLRGGRRYSDKARQMIGRYAQTLDAVQSERVARRGLTPDERADIREEVEAEFDGMDMKRSEIEAEVTAREKEYKLNPQLTKDEVADINRKAMEATKSGEGVRTEGSERYVPKDEKKRFNYYRSEFMDAAMEEKKQRMYQLDAEGYHAAMRALREQFPYFVEEPRVQKIPRGNEKDSGYVRPNYNRPKAVQAGYFDEEINGKGKFNASELHYQNYGVSSARRAAVGNEGEKAAVASGAAPKKINLDEARVAGQAIALHKAAVKQAAEKGASIIGSNSANRLEFKAIARFQDRNNDISAFSDADIQALVKDLESLEVKAKASSDVSDADTAVLSQAVANIKMADQQLKSTVTFDEKTWNPAVVSKYPQRMSERPEHTHNNEPGVYVTAFDKLVGRNKLDDLVTTNPTDATLYAAQEKVAAVHAAAKAFAADPENADVQLKFIIAAQNAGYYSEENIKAIRDSAIRGDTTRAEQVANQTGVKARAIYELRGILSAAGGSLTRSGGAKEVSTGSIPGEVVRSNVRSTPLYERVRGMAANMPTKALKSGIEELANSLEYGDKRAVEESLENLPEDIATPIRRELANE
jgi:hypothetical protein